MTPSTRKKHTETPLTRSKTRRDAADAPPLENHPDALPLENHPGRQRRHNKNVDPRRY
tara:strand:+ start:581 stop:754 length:174 start_codon:yes stop_codon:yes gene_type:complete